jgi:hypothetical protein
MMYQFILQAGNMGSGMSMDLLVMVHSFECHVRLRPQQEIEARLFLRCVCSRLLANEKGSGVFVGEHRERALIPTGAMFPHQSLI